MSYLKMVSQRDPPWKKRTPRNYPELQKIWEDLYKKLHVEQGMGKSKSLETIGILYGGLSRQTVFYFLFPCYRNHKKKREAKRWYYQKQVPRIRQRITEYKSRYMKARRHIDELVVQAFDRTPENESLTLENLAYRIHETSCIFFRPETIMGLVKHYNIQRVSPLLEEEAGFDPPRYKLFKDT